LFICIRLFIEISENPGLKLQLPYEKKVNLFGSDLLQQPSAREIPIIFGEIPPW
jgi:hypothetical protein